MRMHFLYLILGCLHGCGENSSHSETGQHQEKTAPTPSHKMSVSIYDIRIIDAKTISGRRWEMRFQINKKLEGANNLEVGDLVSVNVSSPVRFTKYPDQSRPAKWLITFDSTTQFTDAIDELQIIRLEPISSD